MTTEQPTKSEQHIVAGNVLPVQVECQTVNQFIEQLKVIALEHGDKPVLIPGKSGGHVQASCLGAAEFIDEANVEYDSQEDRYVHKVSAETHRAVFIE